MSKLFRSDGISWIPVPDGTSLKVPIGGTYQPPQKLHYPAGGVWAQAWSKSDQRIVTFFPTVTTALRWNGSAPAYDPAGLSADNTRTDMHNGRFAGSAPYHHTSMMKFDGNSNEGLGTLAAAMAVRPVVKSASIRLHRVSGGLSSPAGDLRVGTWSQLNLQTLPATTLDGTYHDWDPHTVTSVGGWSFGQNRTFAVYPQTIYDLLDGKALMFAEVLSGYMTSGGTTSAYMRIYGLLGGDLGKLPLLTVVLDIV